MTKEIEEAAMADKVLIYNRNIDGYLTKYSDDNATELCNAKLVKRPVAERVCKNNINYNIVEIEDAFTSLQLQMRYNNKN
jgi:hypothetical protein